MNWDTSVYDRNGWEDIFGMSMLLSRELWILGEKRSLDPCVSEVQEAGYPELGPAQIFLHVT